VIERRTITRPNGVVEEVVRTTPPDHRAAIWWLTHALPGTWRDGAQVIEITGPNGGPLVPAEDTSLEGRLAARVAQVTARHAAEAKALGVGDALPAENGRYG
jgi:hypothetical protein